MMVELGTASETVESPRAVTDLELRVDEEVLRTILRAMMRLERPTTSAIAEETGICEDCVEQYLQFAELIGFAERA